MGSDVNTRLLAAVSRSFYLSLRFLPRKFRACVSTAYLIARATDTVADTALATGEKRLSILGEMKEALEGSYYENLLVCLKEELAPSQPHQGEKELLARYREVMEQFLRLPPQEQLLVKEVMAHIIEGQRLDLERFDCEVSRETILTDEGVCSLKDESALLEYTYLVAGCVGEFWTKLGLEIYADEYSSVPRNQLLSWGRHYGQALQLVNILRDVEEDRIRGRQYLPPGISAEQYISLTHGWLEEGIAYTESLFSGRLRFATGLPALIGRETLSLLGEQNEGGKVKVSRKKVYALLCQAVFASSTSGGWGSFIENRC